jgi:hypothetical protein
MHVDLRFGDGRGYRYSRLVTVTDDRFCRFVTANTCDDQLLKRGRSTHTGPPKVVTPVELIEEIGS